MAKTPLYVSNAKITPQSGAAGLVPQANIGAGMQALGQGVQGYAGPKMEKEYNDWVRAGRQKAQSAIWDLFDQFEEKVKSGQYADAAKYEADFKEATQKIYDGLGPKMRKEIGVDLDSARDANVRAGRNQVQAFVEAQNRSTILDGVSGLIQRAKRVTDQEQFDALIEEIGTHIEGTQGVDKIVKNKVFEGVKDEIGGHLLSMDMENEKFSEIQAKLDRGAYGLSPHAKRESQTRLEVMQSRTEKANTKGEIEYQISTATTDAQVDAQIKEAQGKKEYLGADVASDLVNAGDRRKYILRLEANNKKAEAQALKREADLRDAEAQDDTEDRFFGKIEKETGRRKGRRR